MEEEEKRLHRRCNFLLGLFALCLLLFCMILYDAQVVHREDYYAKSASQVTDTESVESSRGIITDTNGKVLVSNKEIYTITLDLDLIPDVEGQERGVTVSRAILRLLELCEDQGVVWTDTLPITTTEPFVYTTASAGSTNRTRFENYLKERKWSDKVLTASDPYPRMTDTLRRKLEASNDVLTPTVLLDLMREDFGVDPQFTDQEARMVVGVLYELHLRSAGTTYTPYTFAEDVPVELISLINDGGFDGVVVSSQSVRQYNTSHAAQLLGQVGVFSSKDERDSFNAAYNAAKEAGEDTTGIHYYAADDTVGKSGVELAFESYLKGFDGERLITTNEAGKITGELYSVEPQPGGTVALTIDIDFQAAVVEALAKTVTAMTEEDGDVSRGAAAVVLSVEDSSVLAMASYPTYNPADYYSNYSTILNADGRPLLNRATGYAYAPGSTFKPCTAVAALETGAVSLTEKVNCPGLWYYPNTREYTKCAVYPGSHGKVNLTRALEVSCNCFFCEMGYRLGIDTLDQYATAFGLGQSTGIELGEETGILAGPEHSAEVNQIWYGGNTVQAAIGQSDHLFTPLQLANYIATLVRGGTRYDAHFLKTVTAYDGSAILYEHEPEVLSQVEISASTLSAVKEGMYNLTSSGSLARYFKDCVVSAGAKTGTAQINADTTNNGVFVCFAPYDDPEIALAIVIERGGSGSALASTAVEILNAYFADSDIGTALIPEGSLLP